ncbi:MAG: hypothetical protein BM557_01305 [Flavobacterium sp. MedPE-SWcel]|uniref:antirestriction protein ArdA n=1 Tax=uncultured Flavobacterium sp. TaxID=165435 RepID=UPI00091074F1|nr:antirestriction protein ArdA [uncultured Flavobacterium sp.]OIQ22044.1 MAG: hypothetical protein BM557_01305 [Flavobacterium sp. MedPE-SWcel]
MSNFDFSTQPSLYVGTYEKYNNCSISGDWLTLTDYSDAEEFLEACKELHCDEEQPEFMFQDQEYLPDFLYSESASLSELKRIYEYVELIDDLEDVNWVYLNNEYCNNTGVDNYIYEFTDDFFDTHFFDNPTNAAMAASFGKINWSDDYIEFNGYGNLESISEDLIETRIDKEEIIAHIIENKESYSL